MKHTFKRHNRVLAVLLAVALMVSMIPMGLALANDEVYPVVVDSSYTGEAGALVDYDAAGYTAADLATYATLTEAMTALGTNGGKVWIKGSYTASSKSELNGVAGRGLVIIAGFNDTQSGNVFVLNGGNNSSSYELSLKGDLTFENIELTLYQANATGNYFSLASYGFYSSGYKLTFGEGIKMTNSGARLGSTYSSTNNNPNGQWISDIDIKSGNFYAIAPSQFQFNTGNHFQFKSGSLRYSIYGGNITYAFTQPVISGGYAAGYLGDFELNVFGGTITYLFVGTHLYSNDGKPNTQSVIAGNTFVNIEEGNVQKVTVGFDAAAGTPGTYYHNPGNMVVTVNGKKSSLTTVVGDNTAQYHVLPENKKFMVIVNNAEGGKAVVNTSNEHFAALIDYNIAISRGKIEPIFEGTGTSSVHNGLFRITPNDPTAPIYIDGELATPIEGETDVYAIEAKGATQINIDVKVDYSFAVVDATFKGEDGEFVDYSDVITVEGVKTTIPTFKTLTAAMSAMGAEGGKVWIKGVFYPVNNASIEAGANVTARKEVVVEGFNGVATGNGIFFDGGYGKPAAEYVAGVNKGYVQFTNDISIAQKGDITFKNIELYIHDMHANDYYRGGGFYSSGNQITFDAGVVMKVGFVNNSTSQYYARLGNQSGGTSYITVKSGNFRLAAPFLNQSSSANAYVANATYVIEGGNITELHGTAANHNTSITGYWKNAGNYNVIVKGGTVTNMYVGTYYHGTPSVSQGNLIYDIKEGNVSTVWFGHYANLTNNGGFVYNQDDFTITKGDSTIEVPKTGNIAVIVNGNKSSRTTVNAKADVPSRIFNKLDGKKFVAIVNNAEGGNGVIDATNIPLLDYNIAVYGGEARPVYEGTGLDSVLVGFTLEGAEGYVPSIDGVVINKAEGKDYYVLAAKGQEQIRIDFLDPNADTFLVGEKRFDNLANAIASLGAEGGTIYVKGELSADNLASATKVAHGLVTIKGYGDSAEGNVLTVANMKATIYGDITFENITLSIASKPIISGTSTITLGKGTVANTIQMGNGNSSGANNVVIDSEYVSMSGDGFATVLTAGTSTVNYNSYITINKGNFAITQTSGIVLGVYANNTGDASTINGDQHLTINGGTFSDIWLGHRGGGSGAKKAVVKGNTVVTVNGGTFTGLYKLSFDSIGVTSEMHNIAYIFNNKNLTHIEKSITVGDNGSVNLTRFNDNSKWIIVSNNAEMNKAGVTLRVSEALDYELYVYGGAAQPIFSERSDAADASTSVLTGFTITPDAENAGKLVVANGTDVLTAVDGMYDLSAYEDFGKIDITFVDEVEIEATEETVTGTELDAYKNGELPAKEGYLFAGYFADGAENAMTADELANAESVIVKFVPKAVLDVKWQIRKADNGVDLRFISTVDSLEYKEVIFKVQVEGKSTVKELSSKHVYTGISGYGENGEELYAPTINSAASKYFMTHILSGIPTAAHESTFTVTACFVTKDEKVIEGETKTFKITDDKNYTEITGNAQ